MLRAPMQRRFYVLRKCFRLRDSRRVHLLSVCPGTRRSGLGYRAMAAWRGVENANLSFHRDGIRDWGADESHTPINVVMNVLDVDFATASTWLSDLVSV